MVLSRPKRGQPLAVLVAPLPAASLNARGIGAAAVILAREHFNITVVSGSQLMELFGLTGAEARVATELITARSLREVAATLGVSIGTVRTHLHRLFDKTGTRRQAELVRLLMALQLP